MRGLLASLLVLALIGSAAARPPRGAAVPTGCVGAACGPVRSITAISPNPGGVGAAITITGTGLLGALFGCCNPVNAQPYSGITVISGGQFLGTISDGTFVINSDTQITYTVPADGATGQFFFGNSAGTAFAPFPWNFTPTTVPAVPTGVGQVSGNAEVDLSWSPVPNGASYNVKRSLTNGSGYATIANVSTASTYQDLSVTNGTTYYYVITSVDSIGESGNSSQVIGTPTLPPAGTATITVTSGTTHAISPYIYGVNSGYLSSGGAGLFPSGASALPTGLVLDRAGGDRFTAYNWTTNASNAGADFIYESDQLFPGTTPASGETNVITFDQGLGMATLMTFQMQGLVASDTAGSTCPQSGVPCTGGGSPPDLTRFSTVQFAKGSAFSLTPNTAHPGPVYMDEFAFNVDHVFTGQGIFTNSPTTHPVFASLDNEPDIWSLTHQEIQSSTEISPSAFITKSIALATALKNQFPQMKIFGPVDWGFTGLYNWQGALSPTPTGSNWFADQYLTSLHSASVTYGAPLVDVYDFHWYSQINDPVTGSQISQDSSATLTDSQKQAIVQSPRSLYDSTFSENSYIVSSILSAPINMIPRLQAKIAAENPGMGIAITEYYTGGGANVAGAIAEADMLGAFGSTGIFASNLYPLNSNFPFITAGFRAFRNFDGAGANFGNTSVLASSSAIQNVQAYVSTDTGTPGRVVMVLINRSNAVQNTTVNGQALSGTAHLYQITSANTASPVITPTLIGTQAASGSSIFVSLPAYSVTTLDIH